MIAINHYTTRTNAERYDASGSGIRNILPAERILLRRVVSANTKVLDAGCGWGRLIPYITSLGAQVFAADCKESYLQTIRKHHLIACISGRVIPICCDISSLPFQSSFFDVVVAACNVLDFIFPEEAFLRTLVELSRVLKANGFLLFSAHNPVGIIFSPRGIRSPKHLTWRLKYLLKGDYRRRYFIDPNNLLLHQATPYQMRNNLSKLGFRLCTVVTRSSLASAWLATAVSAWPYYLFQKSG